MKIDENVPHPPPTQAKRGEEEEERCRPTRSSSWGGPGWGGNQGKGPRGAVTGATDGEKAEGAGQTTGGHHRQGIYTMLLIST